MAISQDAHRALRMGLLLVCCSCATAPSPRDRQQALVQREVDLDLAHIPLPMPGQVQLSLFVNAGARDATPPQLATLAAWAAEAAAGGQARAWVYPEAIELELRCARSAIADCLQTLAKGISARKVEPKRAAALRKRLRDGRRAAWAADPGRGADRLALEALFEDSAHGFFPLGRAQDDARATARAIEGFLASHFGRDRALLVAVGDTTEGDLSQALERAFAKAPKAGQVRPSATAEPAGTGDPPIRVSTDSDKALSLALWGPDLQTIDARGRFLRDHLRRTMSPAAPLPLHTFPVRGGALAMLRLDGAPQVRTVQQAAAAHARFDAEAPDHGRAPSPPLTDPNAAARALGLSWAAGGQRESSAATLGLGVVVEATPAHAPNTRSGAPSSALHSLTQAYRQGIASAAPSLTGPLNDAQGNVRLANGARITARYREGTHFGLSLRLRGGSALDPPTQHGRAALLSAVLVQGCSEAKPPQAAALRLGVRPRHWVEPDGLGVSVSAPATHFAEVVEDLLDCWLHPDTRPQALQAARLWLRQRQGRSHRAADNRAAAAALAAPAAPGLWAPLGHAAGAAAVGEREARTQLELALRGERLQVGLVGPHNPEAVLPRIARRLALLPRGKPAPESPVPGPAVPPATGGGPNRGQTLLLWMGPPASSASGAAGALAFAAVARAMLNGRPGVTTTWHAGDAGPAGSWAGVVLRHADAFDPQHVAPPGELLEDAVDRTLGTLLRERGATYASLHFQAWALAGGSVGVEDAPSRARALAAARRLSQAKPWAKSLR